MLRTLARPLVNVVERWMPSSLVFAIVLTFLVAVLAFALTGSGPIEVLRGWGDGLAGLLEFIAQIAIVLVLGYTLAHTGPMQRLLERMAELPRSAVAAYGFVTVCAGIASLVSWGLGLIVGGILAAQIGRSARRRGLRLHYPLLVASAYSGFVIWHMGYSGSGPLAAATPGSFFEQLAPIVPVTETIFAPWNIASAVVTLAAVTGAMMLLAPKGDDPVLELPAEQAGGSGGVDAADAAEVDTEQAGGSGEVDAADAAEVDTEETSGRAASSPAERMDGSRATTMAIGLALVAYLVVYLVQEGFALTLDIVNWTFLAAILLLVGSPRELGQLITEAGRTVGQILLQYPLYAGILGMMTATGLVEVFSEFFVGISTPGTLGTWAFLSGGLVNFFIPSGGGQFAVQAPIFVQAAQQLGVEPAPVIMGIAYGDQWTNMIQPFWTIPLLAVAGLSVRDILGYSTITLVISGLVFAATLLLVGAG